MTRLEALVEELKAASPELLQQLEEYLAALLEEHAAKPKPKQKYLRLSWAGALRALRDEYTSVELQKMTLEWRGQLISPVR